jgi:hypothetical protein
MSNPCLPPALDPPAAMQKLLQRRVKRFQGYKKGVLSYWIQEYEGSDSTKEEKKGITYPVAQFKKLLNILLDGTKNYSGVRIYFATYHDYDLAIQTYIPGEYRNLMTVIFTPTRTEQGNNNCDKKEKDSEDYYYLIPDLTSSTDNDVIPLTTQEQKDMKEDWIKFFRNKKIVALEHAAGHTFKETEAVWFDKESIQSWDRAILKAKDPIKQVILGFAMYDDGDLRIPGPHGGAGRKVDNQLSVVLSISTELLVDTYFVPRIKSQFTNANTDNFIKYFTDYYDTGKPCPPPTAGCS